MEAGPGTAPNYDGSPEQTVAGTAPAPQATSTTPVAAPIAAAPAKALSAPGVPEGDADTATMPTTAITNADGKLTLADAKIIQQVLIKTGNLPAKQANGSPSDDGKVGPGTKAAIGYFRQAFGIYDDPEVIVNPQTGVTLGPKTLAQVNAVIAKPELLSVSAGTPAQTAETPAPAAQPAAATGISADQIIKLISDKFADKAFWKPFKGRGGIFGNDDEKAAVQGFTAWFNSEIKPKIDQLPAADPNKAAFVSLLAQLTSGITRKLNKVAINYTDSTGKPMSTTVNSDF